MLLLICGRSRAGKTTYSKKFNDVLHCDNIKAYLGEKLPKIYQIVSQKQDIVVDGIFNTRQDRKDLINSYKGKHPLICVFMDTDIDVIKYRAGRVLPKHFEPPTYDEGWDEIRIIRNGEETIITNLK